MPLTIDWPEIAFRLFLSVVAGTLLGLNRTERGMTAGLRTTLLVSLAATISMIQVNLLLITSGKTPDSFPVLDLMRLPLGILTGMGFIGAGAIIRQKGRVSGITTAATLWLATVLGLCFGGGQHGLGLASLIIGVLILWILKRIEIVIPQERRGMLSVSIDAAEPTEEEIRSIIRAGGGDARLWNLSIGSQAMPGRRKISCHVSYSGTPADPAVPEFVHMMAGKPGVRVVRWRTL